MDGNHQLKVRLAQIDAPESKQPFGNQSKKSLSDMVFNKTIRVEKETIDKYGWTVGTLFVGDLDVNKEQIKRGMARVYPKYAHDPALFNLEAEARQASLGLWSDPTSMPPWEFRHKGEQGYTPGQQVPSITQTSNTIDGSCGKKRFCKQMVSCEEAIHYLTQCGLSRLDKDGDGRPCESLCGKVGK